MRPSGALLPLLALCTLTLSAEAAPCRPDNTNTTVTVKSKKFYCSEGFDSEGCNIGNVVLKIDVDTSCRNSRHINLICSADMEITTRNVEKLPKTVSTRERIELEKGRASEKVYIPWKDFGNPAMEVDVTAASCRIDDGSVPPAPEAEEEEETETAPETMPEPAKEPVSAPAEQPATRPAAAPAPGRQQQETHPEMTREEYELQMLREQNRAKELDIKALELKIKLKEMEQNEK